MEDNTILRALGRIEGILEEWKDLPGRVNSLEQDRSRLRGWLAAISTLLTAVTFYLVWIRGPH